MALTHFRNRKKSLKQPSNSGVPREDEEQKRVILFLRVNYPLILFCASAGGMRTSMKQAMKMKATGYVSGFPDLFIYEPRGMYHGLAIEMKRIKGGAVSSEQKEWQQKLRDRNYKAEICKGAVSAMKIIQEYLGQE